MERDDEFEASAFFEDLVGLIPRFAVPRDARVVEALPQTPTQRVQKYMLRADGVTSDICDRELLGTVPARD